MKLTSSSTFNCIIVAAFLLDSRGGEQKWKNDCRDLESRKLNPGKLSRLAEAWQQVRRGGGTVCAKLGS
jgi:hypothetical protein